MRGIIAWLKKHWIVTTMVGLILFKIVWVAWACWDNDSFESEKEEILQRKNFLADKIIVEPLFLLCQMPGVIDLQFQGEWALYSCSMFATALANIATLYPETREESITMIDSLIKIVKSPELRLYDKMRWGEDPLESLSGDNSHISYISHLAWMIGSYKRIGGGNSHDMLHDSLCETMNRRILQSPTLNIPTYPDEPIYVPDMLVAIVALSDYAKLNNKKYATTVNRWIEKAKQEWCDKGTGLLVSFLDDSGKTTAPIKGSYSALNCYYLTLIATDFATEQYTKLKTNFAQNFPLSGIREYHNRTCWVGMDIDAGPVILNLSPSGTAFAVGSATYFNDMESRNKLLKTCEIAGHTVEWNNHRHYLLSNVALVGEAITLAMRTNTLIHN